MKAVMVILIFGASIWAVITGIISLLATDLSWELTEWRNARRGMQSERTENWAWWDRLQGSVLLVVGLLLLLLTFYYAVYAPA